MPSIGLPDFCIPDGMTSASLLTAHVDHVAPRCPLLLVGRGHGLSKWRKAGGTAYLPGQVETPDRRDSPR